MRKIKMFFVSLLAMMLALFCFASCGEAGKYTLVSYQKSNGDVTIVAESASFVELGKENEATISIDLGIFTLNGEGTWAKSEEEKKTLLLDLNIGDYKAVKSGKTLKVTINMLGAETIFIFEK